MASVTDTAGASTLGRIAGSASKLGLENSSAKESAWNVLWRNGSHILDVLLIISLLSIETVFQDRLFECPCDAPAKKMTYGGAFLVVPAIVLFILSVFSNVLTWRLVYGFCGRPQKGRHCRSLLPELVRRVLPRALAMPFIWLIYAFLDGKFYECMASSDVVCQEGALAAVKKTKMRATSQIIGMVLLFLGVSGYIAVRCIVRAFTSRSFYMWQYNRMYEQTLSKTWIEQCQNHAEIQSKKQVKLFIEKGLSDGNWMDFGLTDQIEGEEEELSEDHHFIAMEYEEQVV